jgi:hypothetical protein
MQFSSIFVIALALSVFQTANGQIRTGEAQAQPEIKEVVHKSTNSQFKLYKSVADAEKPWATLVVIHQETGKRQFFWGEIKSTVLSTSVYLSHGKGKYQVRAWQHWGPNKQDSGGPYIGEWIVENTDEGDRRQLPPELQDDEYNLGTTSNSLLVLNEPVNAKDFVSMVIKKTSGVYSGQEERWYLTPKTGKLTDTIGLVHGAGQYTISLNDEYKHASGETYRYQRTLTIENTDIENRLFLLPSYLIESQHPKIVSLVESLTKGLTTEKQKAHVIYDWMMNNMHLGNGRSLNSALYALENSSVHQWGLARLNVALNRAAGLRAKVVGKFPDIENQRKMEVWSEVMVDSVWYAQDVYNELDDRQRGLRNEEYKYALEPLSKARGFHMKNFEYRSGEPLLLTDIAEKFRGPIAGAVFPVQRGDCEDFYSDECRPKSFAKLIEPINVLSENPIEKLISTEESTEKCYGSARMVPGEFYGVFEIQADTDVKKVCSFSLINTFSDRINPTGNGVKRDYGFHFKGYARNNVHLYINEDSRPRHQDNLVSETTMDSIFVFFPRIQIPMVEWQDGELLKVYLPNGEEMFFNLHTSEMVPFRGVLSETTPIDTNPVKKERKFAGIEYSGLGVVVRADYKGYAAQHSGKFPTAKILFDDKVCEVSKSQLWELKHDDYRFRFINDEDFYAFVETECGWPNLSQTIKERFGL